MSEEFYDAAIFGEMRTVRETLAWIPTGPAGPNIVHRRESLFAGFLGKVI